MIQTLMIESFENSRKIVSVGRESIGLRADFILKSDLRELQAVYYNGGLPAAWVSINAKLVQLPRRAIVASQSFDAKVTAEAATLQAVVTAFDDDSGKVLRRPVDSARKRVVEGRGGRSGSHSG